MVFLTQPFMVPGSSKLPIKYLFIGEMDRYAPRIKPYSSCYSSNKEDICGVPFLERALMYVKKAKRVQEQIGNGSKVPVCLQTLSGAQLQKPNRGKPPPAQLGLTLLFAGWLPKTGEMGSNAIKVMSSLHFAWMQPGHKLPAGAGSPGKKHLSRMS